MILPVEDKIRIKTGERWSGMAEKSRVMFAETRIESWWRCDLLFSQKNGYPMENGDSILEYEDPEAPKMGVWWSFLTVGGLQWLWWILLKRWQWILMAVVNIALRWQWTLMAVMTLYKRTSELQRWRTTPAVMNSTDEPASFNSSELLRQWRTP